MINLIFLIFLISFILLYFKIAEFYKILDYPNHRSSHDKPIVRGGGVIFPVTYIFFSLFFNCDQVYFLIGLFFVSAISFIDDLVTLPSSRRFIIHILAALLLSYQISVIYSIPWYMYILIFSFVISVINAFNFMDGINGITGLYSLVCLFTLYSLKSYFSLVNFDTLIIWLIASCLIFLFFNFRKRAYCFGGDIGSISISFIIVYFVLLLVLESSNFKYLLFLFVYGFDTAYTLVYRIIIGDKLTTAHRLHFFQLLVHEYHLSHRLVSVLFALSQLLLNVWIITRPLNVIFIAPFILIIIIVEILRSKISFSIFNHK